MISLVALHIASYATLVVIIVIISVNNNRLFTENKRLITEFSSYQLAKYDHPAISNSSFKANTLYPLKSNKTPGRKLAEEVLNPAEILKKAHKRDDGTTHRNIFIDLGSTEGEMTDCFLGATPYGTGVPKGYQGLGLNKELKKWDVYLVEARDDYTSTLFDHVKQRFLNRSDYVNSVTINCPMGVGVKNGNFTMYGTGVGTTIIPGGTSSEHHGKLVQIMDIYEYLRHTVRAHHKDFIMMKIDIEGMEYDILRRLYGKGMISWFDHLFIEWHGNQVPGAVATSKECLNWLSHGLDNTIIHEWS